MIPLTTSETVRVPLDDVTEVTPGTPVALVKCMSVKRLKQYEATWNEAYQSNDPDVNEKAMQRLSKLAIVGLENATDDDGQPVAFNAADPFDSLASCMTYLRLWKFLGRIPVAVSLGESDAKKSAPRAPDCSAEHAAPVPVTSVSPSTPANQPA